MYFGLVLGDVKLRLATFFTQAMVSRTLLCLMNRRECEFYNPDRDRLETYTDFTLNTSYDIDRGYNLFR